MMATAASQIRKISRDETGQLTEDGPPSHLAILNNDVAALQKLIQAGAPHYNAKTRETALHVAARTGSLTCLQWLMDNRIGSPMDKDANGSTCCHYAAVYGNLDALKILLLHDDKHKDEIAAQQDDNGLTVLALATLQGDLKMVEFILENFPSLGEVTDTGGTLPIHFAAAGGSLAIVKHLITLHGRGYAERADNNSTKPVYYAAQNGKMDVLKYLINDIRVKPLAREKVNGMTTIHAASTANQLPTVKWLVEKLGKDVIISKSDDGATSLHIASAQGYVELLTYLVENLEDGSDINVQDHIQATPLHDAAEFGESQTMLVLLENGADLNIKDNEDKTPYDLAKEKNNKEMVAIINDYRKHGPSALKKYKRKPLRQVLSNGSAPSPSNNSRDKVKTSRDEIAHEILGLKAEVKEVIDKRTTSELTRKQSLLRLNTSEDEQGQEEEDGMSVSDGDELEQQLLKDRDSHKKRSSRDRAPDHYTGPEGEIYAKVNKRHKFKFSSSSETKDEQSSDLLSQTSSQHSNDRHGHGHDGPYFARNPHMSSNNNLDTASMLSRPSRVKHYENDSTSSIGSSASQHAKRGRHHPPGFYPGEFPPGPGSQYPPSSHHSQYGPQRYKSGSSVASNRSGHHYPPPQGGYPPMMAYPNYPYYPAMVAQYYGYPNPPQGYPQPMRPKTTEERIHMEALQKRGRALYPQPRPGYPFPYHHGHHHNHHRKHRQTSEKALSMHSLPVGGNKGRHIDGEIGYGPSSVVDEIIDSSGDQKDTFHPPPPPITKGGQISAEQTELTSMDHNFIMVKRDGEGKLPSQAAVGTQLQAARPPTKYDGRYDEFVETDSEGGYEVGKNVSVARLAESCLILALGPVTSLMGLSKVRKDEPKNVVSPVAYSESEDRETAKLWSSQQELLTIGKAPDEAEQATKPLNRTESWTDILGIPSEAMTVVPTMKSQQISGSMRARDYSMQELKTSSLPSKSLASLDKDIDDNDDIVSIIQGDESFKDEINDGKSKSKSKKSKTKKGKEKKQAKKSRLKKSKEEKKEEKKEREKKPKNKKSAKKLIVKPSNEAEKEIKLRTDEVVTGNATTKEVVSVGVRAPSDEPREVANTAIISDSDSDGEPIVRKKGDRSSDNSLDTIFAEAEKEINEILAGIPKSPEGSIDGDMNKEENQAIDKENLDTIKILLPSAKDATDVTSLMTILEEEAQTATPQQQIRLQLIKNILSVKDNLLMAKLLKLLSQGWNPSDDDSTNGSLTKLTAGLEHKFSELQELQRLESAEQFKTHKEISEKLEKKFEETTTSYMQSIQQQLNQQQKLIEEQQKMLEQERKKKSKRSSSSSDSDDDRVFRKIEVVRPTPNPVVASKAKIMTMQAKIHHQTPIKWDDYKTDSDTSIPDPPPPPPVSTLLENVRLGTKPRPRRGTSADLNETSAAFERFVSGEDGEMPVIQAKIATRKRADIKTVEQAAELTFM